MVLILVGNVPGVLGGLSGGAGGAGCVPSAKTVRV